MEYLHCVLYFLTTSPLIPMEEIAHIFFSSQSNSLDFLYYEYDYEAISILILIKFIPIRMESF